MPNEPNLESERRCLSIRLPRPLWFGLAALVIAAAYAGLYWHNLRTGPCVAHGRTGIKYFLDSERAFAHAKIWNKPVFVYFTGVNCVNARRMERGVLRAPAVVERLQKFICFESFVDSVPLSVVADRKEADRLLSQNIKLYESFGDVSLPSFVVLPHDFDPTRDAGRFEPIAQTSGLILDEATFVRFLDEALEKWAKLR
jgi:hypothetical protein